MYALLTLPRGVPIDPETRAALRRDDDEPVGIIIRPGPAPLHPKLTLRATLAAART